MTFMNMGLEPELVVAISRLGFETPTPVQAQVIPRLLDNKGDVVALAQTGTGKTAAFGLPILTMLDRENRAPQALVLCPTRELCVQITRDMEAYAACSPGVSILAVYGGTPIEAQLRALKRGVHVIVGTPGRMLDIMRRRRVNLDGVERVILDEADEMLNMGFQEDLEAILAGVPDSAHTLLFSATMPRQVASMAKKYMHEAEEITVGQRNAGAANVRHDCYVVHQRDRYRTLKRIADYYPDMYAIVFCRTRQDTQGIADWLIRDGYNADSLHGDLTQVQRDRVMDKFRSRNLQILVATDVAARGLDVNDLTHVINFNLPDDLNSYTHRSGRTGRAGKSGISVVIVNMREKGRVQRIQRMIGSKFEFRKVPNGRQVCEAQLLSMIERMRGVEVDHEQIDVFLPAINRALEGMEQDEIVKRFVALEFNTLLKYYRDTGDLATSTPAPRSGKAAKPSPTPRPAPAPMAPREQTATAKAPAAPEPAPAPAPPRPREVRMFINIGQLDGINPKKLSDMINRECNREVPVRKIDIMRRYSFFEIAGEDADPLTIILCKARFAGRDVRVEPVNDELKSKRIKRTERRIKAKGGKPGPRKPRKLGKAGKRKPTKGKPSRAQRREQR
ncbi:MAG: DEAD/DEAH box helicase [Kiritimatiellae bacterium]|nr:DEAD/DEAH box helicase [Kiritimatiellia bacterium]